MSTVFARGYKKDPISVNDIKVCLRRHALFQAWAVGGGKKRCQLGVWSPPNPGKSSSRKANHTSTEYIGMVEPSPLNLRTNTCKLTS